MTTSGLICSVADSITQPKGLWEPLLRFLSSRLPSYVVAVIVFTVLLKLFLSPLDFFQKYKMKKNAKIGEKLQPEMDKLAKRYADDKAELQRRQFQLQKASGYSYFSACIPMIVTMIIFLTFFAGMRNISQFEEFSQYVNRYDIYSSRYAKLTGLSSEGYNGSSEEFDVLINDWHLGLSTSEQGYALKNDAFLTYKGFANFDQFYCDYILLAQKQSVLTKSNLLHIISDTHSYSIDVKYTQGANAGCYNPTALFNGSEQALGSEYNLAMNNYLIGLRAKLTQLKAESQDFDDIALSFDTKQDFLDVYSSLLYYDTVTEDYLPILIDIAIMDSAKKVYDDYVNKDSGFLWIKSIWVADVFWENAVPDYDKFRVNTAKYMVNNVGGLDDKTFNAVSKRETYNSVMQLVIADGDLSGANGWLILAVLALGLSFLSQFILTRQQKKSGTTMTSNTSMKMMTYLMPVIFGVFALFSTSAFSIYMVTNSLMTLLINLLTSFVIGLIFAKQTKSDYNEQGILKHGRPDPNSFNKKK